MSGMIAGVSLVPLAATAALGVACAVLSVFVVARRWAFIGEGISHSGFGGAGVAWLITLALPGAQDQRWLLYGAVVLFCLGTALAIGYLSRGNRVTGDAAIGIFLVASLAFGFLAREIFLHVRHGAEPPDFVTLLFGGGARPDARMMSVVILVSTGVVAVVLGLWKEILAYCFDPQMAEAAGVCVGFVHYLLMVLIAVVIMIGMPITGSLLVTALLVLPGVTGNLLSRRLQGVMFIAITSAVISAVAGVTLNAAWRFIPVGPAVVLTLFGQFLLAYLGTRVQRRGD
jgi:ABC-type Mn2+/Zn2+ transport system permease subunit